MVSSMNPTVAMSTCRRRGECGFGSFVVNGVVDPAPAENLSVLVSASMRSRYDLGVVALRVLAYLVLAAA